MKYYWRIMNPVRPLVRLQDGVPEPPLSIELTAVEFLVECRKRGIDPKTVQVIRDRGEL